MDPRPLPKTLPRLDAAERLRHVPAEALLSCLPLKRGMRFLDAGCGEGAFFFPVFEKLEGEGVFIAAELHEDLLRHFLSRLEGYAEHPRFTRIEVCRAEPDRMPLPDACVDAALVPQVYHEVKDRPRYLAELKRVLAPGGTLCLLDWQTLQEAPGIPQDARHSGPPFDERVAESQALIELEEAGFRWPVSVSGFIHHWCLSARK